MSYTNSTPNLHLPQYIATDKPTYLGDWNASMQTIDTVITSTQATANGASSTATSANSVALAAQVTANTANEKANINATDIEEYKNSWNWTQLDLDLDKDYESVSAILMNSEHMATLALSTGVTVLTSKGTVSGSNTLNVICSTVGNIFNLETSNITENKFWSMFGFTYRYYGSGGINDAVVVNGVVRAYFDGANTNFYSVIPTSTITSTPNVNIWGNIAIPKPFSNNT